MVFRGKELIEVLSRMQPSRLVTERTVDSIRIGDLTPQEAIQSCQQRKYVGLGRSKSRIRSIHLEQFYAIRGRVITGGTDYRDELESVQKRIYRNPHTLEEVQRRKHR